LQQSLKRDEQLFAEGLIAESRCNPPAPPPPRPARRPANGARDWRWPALAPGKLGGLALTAPIDGVVLEQSRATRPARRNLGPDLPHRQLSPLWLEIQAPLERCSGCARPAPRRNRQGRRDHCDPARSSRLKSPVRPASSSACQRRRIARNQGSTLAFVQTANDDKGTTFAVRPVRIVSQGGDSVTVDGIKAGERVAVKGVSGLKAMLTGVGKE
jgi:cobalt-zinc-cadmium efflux system membrane fusion protein